MMKSPYTGKEMKAIYEKRTWKFRGETYEYYHQAWLCEDTHEQFTTDASDDAGFIQVTNQYRYAYGIPFTDEIIEIRKRYGISASKMSLILGLGTNQYRLYEQGEVPSVSNGRMIRSILNPNVMLDFVNSSKHELSASEYEKITRKIQAVIQEQESEKIDEYEKKRLFAAARSPKNGFAPLSLSRLKNIMLYLLDKCDNVWCTKMNKLLFYIDFLSYRNRGIAMSGLTYQAIQFGPVPERWDKVYSEFSEIHQELQQVGDFVGSVLRADQLPDTTLFDEEEIRILEYVCTHFGKCTARELSRLSHQEKAWMNHHEEQSFIPFDEAFFLRTPFPANAPCGI